MATALALLDGDKLKALQALSVSSEKIATAPVDQTTQRVAAASAGFAASSGTGKIALDVETPVVVNLDGKTIANVVKKFYKEWERESLHNQIANRKQLI